MINTLTKALRTRAEEGRLRELGWSDGLVDFCSNDYLGFARDRELAQRLEERMQREVGVGLGATGSRLISGHNSFFERLESKIAAFHRAQAALIFNSGYVANLGLLACLPQRGDTVLYDELCHASLRDGARLSFAASYGFRHNDVEALREKISRAKGQVFVVVESIYSMDGDFAPLRELTDVCREKEAALIVDEAHATGVCGPNGEGRVVELGLEKDVFARVHTFGKALGSHGAAVLGDRILYDYLVNFCRPFIYTTALPPHTLLCIEEAYNLLQSCPDYRLKLRRVIELFYGVQQDFAQALLPSQSAIQSVIIPGNNNVKSAALALQAQGFDVRAIMSPTVAQGKERLRICLHAFNSDVEVRGLCRAVHEILQEVRAA